MEGRVIALRTASKLYERDCVNPDFQVASSRNLLLINLLLRLAEVGR